MLVDTNLLRETISEIKRICGEDIYSEYCGGVY